MLNIHLITFYRTNVNILLASMQQTVAVNVSPANAPSFLRQNQFYVSRTLLLEVSIHVILEKHSFMQSPELSWMNYVELSNITYRNLFTLIDHKRFDMWGGASEVRLSSFWNTYLTINSNAPRKQWSVNVVPTLSAWIHVTNHFLKHSFLERQKFDIWVLRMLKRLSTIYEGRFMALNSCC